MEAKNNHKLDKGTDRLYQFTEDKRMYQVLLEELITRNGMSVGDLLDGYKKYYAETQRLNSLLAGILLEAGVADVNLLKIINDSKTYSTIVETEDGYITEINKITGNLITKYDIDIPTDVQFECYYIDKEGKLAFDEDKFIQLTTVL